MELRRRDVILSAIAAFIAWGYAVHWFPALRWLPYAFLAGAVTAVAAIAALFILPAPSPSFEDDSVRRPKRHVKFVEKGQWNREVKELEKRAQYLREPLYAPSFVISDNIDGLLDLILRDFVRSWYDKISTRPSFIIEVDRAVRTALASIRDRILDVDLVETGVSRVVPIITGHFREFYEAERSVKGKKLSRNVTESEELDFAIAGKYRDGKLHAAASLAYSNTSLVQQQYLRSTVTRLLPKVLPRNMTTSPAVNVLIVEIVACAVLYPLMQMFSDPDFWNQLVESQGRALLQERKTVRKVRAALDEHAPPSPSQAVRPTQFPKISPGDNERRFERFIRAIRQCNTLSDARRFRSEIASQLRRDVAMEGQDPVYLRRLEIGKQNLDQKIARLGAGSSLKLKPEPLKSGETAANGSTLKDANLRQVLYDASGLSYFMEYMDRVNRMSLVQFYVVVDGLRNPLEEDLENEPVKITHMWTESERNDVSQIYEAYLSKPELDLASEARAVVKTFLRAGNKATPAEYHAARSAIVRAQRAVYQEMAENNFPKFKQSDLFFKWLATEQAGAATGLTNPDKIQSSLPELPRTQSAGLRSKASRLSSFKRGNQAADLRRAAMSSQDLKSLAKDADELPARRSLDAPSSPSPRKPLFDDEDDETDGMANSTQSLDSEPEDARRGSQDRQAVDQMQTALNRIMDDQVDQDQESLFSDKDSKTPLDDDSMRGSMEISRPSSPSLLRKGSEKPSLASLGLVGAMPSSRGVFRDDLFGDEEKFLEDEVEESPIKSADEADEIHEAAPGDLGLAEAVDALSADIERLVSQESIIDSLTKKAELTNNAAELRILRKSKASLQREVHRKELQRQQYIVQESDNSLYGRATVSIQRIMVGNDEDGKEFAMYVIEVRKRATDQVPAAAWVVARRYSEFHELNKRLRARFGAVRNLEFPRRQVVLKLQKDFLQKRRAALEKYLTELLLIPAVCRSRELRAFLSQQAILPVDPTNSQANNRDFVTRIYNSVTDGMEEFLGNIPVLDQLTVAGQNLISAATTQLNTTQNGTLTPLNGNDSPVSTLLPPSSVHTFSPIPSNDALEVHEAEAELRAFESRELEPFVKPICDLFLEIFELNRDNNWLRGRAVVVVLHQLLGGTIERKVRDNVRTAMEEDNVVKYLDVLKHAMWPGGKPKGANVPRTTQEKESTRKEAAMLLGSLIPDLAGSVVGRGNAQAASRRISATLNNQRLK